jgi:hypothetical protein
LSGGIKIEIGEEKRAPPAVGLEDLDGGGKNLAVEVLMKLGIQGSGRSLCPKGCGDKKESKE